MAGSGHELEQRIIDHEVRLARAEAAIARVRAARQAREARRQALTETLWVRDQYVAMLRTATSLEELHALGLSDEMMREVRLGESLEAVWRQLRSPPPYPPGSIGPGRWTDAATGAAVGVNRC